MVRQEDAAVRLHLVQVHGEDGVKIVEGFLQVRNWNIFVELAPAQQINIKIKSLAVKVLLYQVVMTKSTFILKLSHCLKIYIV